MTLSEFVGIFNVFVGILLVAALLFFFGGFVLYLVRLGTEHRSEGLDYMKQGNTILFILVVLLIIVQFIQHVFV